MYKNLVQLDIYSENKILESKTVDIYEWYDGTVEEIDSDTYRESNKITMIKGILYNNEGIIDDIWINYYDKLGRLTKLERYDSKLNLLDTDGINYDVDGRII